MKHTVVPPHNAAICRLGSCESLLAEIDIGEKAVYIYAKRRKNIV
jgi:hypothetical protein